MIITGKNYVSRGYIEDEILEDIHITLYPLRSTLHVIYCFNPANYPY